MGEEWHTDNKEKIPEGGPDRAETEETDGTVALPRWLAEEITAILSTPDEIEENPEGGRGDPT